MKKVLLSNRYEGELRAILMQANDGRFDLEMLPEVSREAFHELAHDADYIISSGKLGIDEELLKNAPKLKMIQRTGVGVDRIDLDAMKRYGIPLYVNRGVNAVSVAEYTLMLILAALKRHRLVDAHMRAGAWDKTAEGVKTRELAGRTVGLIGMGKIGSAVARMLSGFDTDVIYTCPHRKSAEEEERFSIRYTDLDTLLAQSDIVSLHCPYDKDKGCMIGERELALMKDGAVLVNTARGRLVDEAALIRALENGKLSACGMDTFAEEPLPKDSVLRSVDRLLLSPHIAGLSYESYERMLFGAFRNIALFDEGKTDVIADCLYS
ncbi:MAG: 2-hydroxyacid dehydrogenase [Lachnospiraceae bacterium]|nr:2-hydroxyacid dehydrogenase [Lachnospiraceae bacterium]